MGVIYLANEIVNFLLWLSSIEIIIDDDVMPWISSLEIIFTGLSPIFAIISSALKLNINSYHSSSRLIFSLEKFQVLGIFPVLL